MKTHAQKVIDRIWKELPDYKYDVDRFDLLLRQWRDFHQLIYDFLDEDETETDWKLKSVIPEESYELTDIRFIYHEDDWKNFIHYHGIDPDQGKQIAFNGDLFNFHIAWLWLFHEHYKLDEHEESGIYGMQNHAHHVFGWFYKRPADDVLIKFTTNDEQPRFNLGNFRLS